MDEIQKQANKLKCLELAIEAAKVMLNVNPLNEAKAYYEFVSGLKASSNKST